MKTYIVLFWLALSCIAIGQQTITEWYAPSGKLVRCDTVGTPESDTAWIANIKAVAGKWFAKDSINIVMAGITKKYVERQNYRIKLGMRDNPKRGPTTIRRTLTKGCSVCGSMKREQFRGIADSNLCEMTPAYTYHNVHEAATWKTQERVFSKRGWLRGGDPLPYYPTDRSADMYSVCSQCGTVYRGRR